MEGVFSFARSRRSNNPERNGLLPPDDIKEAMIDAEKLRDTHRKRARDWVIIFLVLGVLEAVQTGIILYLGETTWGIGAPITVVSLGVVITSAVLAFLKERKILERERAAHFALDAFVRKWHGWAYDLGRSTNTRWGDAFNVDNFNATYNQIKDREFNSDQAVMDLCAACGGVAANMPIGNGASANPPPVHTTPHNAPDTLLGAP